MNFYNKQEYSMNLCNFQLACGRTMLVDGGAVWENDRGDGKSLVRDDAVIVDFRIIKLMKLYIRKRLRTQIHN
jgi:hypothetical protein